MRKFGYQMTGTVTDDPIACMTKFRANVGHFDPDPEIRYFLIYSKDCKTFKP